MSYSKEYLAEWERREELLRSLTSAAAALEEAIQWERQIGSSTVANSRMHAVMDHLENIRNLSPKRIPKRYERVASDV